MHSHALSDQTTEFTSARRYYVTYFSCYLTVLIGFSLTRPKIVRFGKSRFPQRCAKLHNQFHWWLDDRHRWIMSSSFKMLDEKGKKKNYEI